MAIIEQPVLILGAGINGAALARELLLNRVPVCMVDTADLCSGATAFSSRLIHGGLRYLEYGELDLVRESLAERTRLLRLAPQFVRPLRLCIPVRTRLGGILAAASGFVSRSAAGEDGPVRRGLWLVRLGLWLYETYARDSTLPRRRVHGVRDAGVPRVDANKYRWLCSYYDAQIARPERFVVALLEDARRLAAEQGISFQLFTYHRATLAGRRIEIHPVDFVDSPLRSSEGRLPSEHTSRDAVASFEPAAIINATGAWVDHTLKRLPVASPPLMAGTKGSHLVTSHPGLRDHLGEDGLYVEAADGRPVFILPFGKATLIGTTDLPFENGPENAIASEEEIEYLLHAVNDVLPDVGLAREHIDLHYSGVRPLPCTSHQAASPPGSSQRSGGQHSDGPQKTGQRWTGAITRRHWMQPHDTCAVPLYSVIGGKLTTCRSLAETGTQIILARLSSPLIANSRDRVVPGGESYPVGEPALRTEREQLALRLNFGIAQIESVWALWGTRTESVLQPSPSSVPSSGDHGNLHGTAIPCRFVRWVIGNEWVRRLEDLVERRLMLVYHPQLSEACLRQLAALMVEAGRLAERDIDSAVAACRARLQTHFGKRLV